MTTKNKKRKFITISLTLIMLLGLCTIANETTAIASAKEIEIAERLPISALDNTYQAAIYGVPKLNTPYKGDEINEPLLNLLSLPAIAFFIVAAIRGILSLFYKYQDKRKKKTSIGAQNDNKE